MKRVLTIAAMTFGVMFSSCGKSKKAAEDAANTDSALWGDWHSSCVSNSILELTKTERNVSFDAANNFGKSEVFYLGDQCEDEDMTVVVDGDYQVQGELDEDKSLKKLNVTIDSVSAIMHSDEAVDLANDQEMCDITDWKKDEERDITGLDCFMALKHGDMILDVYKVDDDKVFFGNKYTFLGENNNDRPTEVDEDIVYVKK